MSQALTPSPISHETHSTLTSKGQVTIPVEVRRYLGIDTNDKIAFVIHPEGTVQIKIPKYPTLASLAGSAGTLKKSLSWKTIKTIIHVEQTEAYKKKKL